MDTKAFARAMERELNAFNEKRRPTRPRRPKHRAAPSHNRDVIVVKLVVREKQLAADVPFLHISDRLSCLEAEIEARKAARGAGYPVFGHVVYIKRGTKQ